MDLTPEEKDLLESVEKGEWQSVPDADNRAKQYQEYAKATFRKDERINIRISQRDLVKLQQRALEEGMPYQTLITTILHKYVQGKLVDKVTDLATS